MKTLHYCYVCRKRKSSPPDGRCRRCRKEGREFVPFDKTGEKLTAISSEIDKIVDALQAHEITIDTSKITD